MNVSDEKLMAYVDGELAAADAAQVEAAIAADAQLQRRVQRQRDLRARLSGAYEAVLDEPVPALLAGLVEPRTVTGLEDARAARTPAPRRHWSLPTWSALAASLVLAIAAGSLFGPDLLRGDSLVTTRGGRLLAAGQLSEALDTQSAGDAAASRVQVGFTFRVTSGEYCRTFALAGTAGFACRHGDDWNVQMLEQLPATDTTGYRQAASALPPALRTAIEARIEGDALDAQAEAALIERRWSPPR